MAGDKMANPGDNPSSGASPPRAAAVAGVLFAILMGTTLVVVRLAIPPNETESGAAWLADPSKLSAVRFASQLAPFAGIAFLWFIGVIRNRLGTLEDRFFASVFLGSGLLFVASLYAAAAFSEALVESMVDGHIRSADSEAYYLARHLARAFLNVFGIKMAGVFMMSTSAIALRTGILPRWLAFSGFACAVVLLLIITNWPWIALIFPLWMLVASACILVAEFHPKVLRRFA